MGDAQLKQYASMHKNDPYILPMAIAESNARKQVRSQAQAKMAGQPQQKVADTNIAEMDAPAVDIMGNVTGYAAGGLPEHRGIARLPAPNIQNMAGGGIVAFADGGEADSSTGVVRMAGGGAGYTEMVRAVLQELGESPQKYLNDPTTKQTVDKLVQERLGAASPSSGPAAGASAAPSAASSKAFELGQKFGPTLKSVGDKLSDIGTTKTSKLPLGAGAATAGVVGVGQGLYEGYKAGDFYNDPNVSSVDKALQATRTATRAGLPIVTAGVGSLFGPGGTLVGGLAGGTASSFIDQEGEALKAWKKAHPQATPAETKKAEAAAAAAATPAANTPADQTPPAANAGAAAAGADTDKTPTLAGPKVTSSADIQSMYSKFAGSPEERQAKLDAVRSQLGSLAGAETLAAKKYAEKIKADQEAQGEYGKDREAKLKTREERLGKEEGQSGGLALLEAGLAIMSGTSPNALANIGQGAMRGTAAYRESQKRLTDARDKLEDAYGRIEDVRFNQKNMNAKELRDAQRDIDKTANAGIRALTDFAMKEYDVSRDEAKTMLSSYTQIKGHEIAAGPGYQRNQMLANADSKMAKERKDYIALQNKTLGDLRKSTDYVTANATQRAQMEIDAMRNALNLNPHLAHLGTNIGFSNAPTGKEVYDLTP